MPSKNMICGCGFLMVPTGLTSNGKTLFVCKECSTRMVVDLRRLDGVLFAGKKKSSRAGGKKPNA